MYFFIQNEFKFEDLPSYFLTTSSIEKCQNSKYSGNIQNVQLSKIRIYSVDILHLNALYSYLHVVLMSSV
jgi:hypothetical protein